MYVEILAGGSDNMLLSFVRDFVSGDGGPAAHLVGHSSLHRLVSFPNRCAGGSSSGTVDVE